MDAPIGYISATKQWALDNNKDWKDYWCNEGTKLVHFIGKDNIVFHCIIFPVILKEMEGFILPTNVPANEFMNLEGEKMSTSRNWSLPVHEFLKLWPDKEDVLRYVLASNLPEAKDSEFTWKDFQARNNNELVAILGNFVNRVLVLTHKFFDGETPSLDKLFSESDYISSYCAQLALIKREQYDPAMESYRFREALSSAMEVVRLGNKLLTDYEPWKLIKTEPETCASVLRVCLESFADIIWLMSPFLPNTADKMMEMAGLKYDDYLLPFGSRLNNTKFVGKPVHLFQRIEDEPINEAINQLKSSKVETAPSTNELKPEITFEDFSKLDIRTAVIESATRIPKADKLLQIEVILGQEKRTIVSGIAEHFEPEELNGKRVLVVANLAPRKMRGVTSEGMILMAEDANGKLYFVGEGESGMSGLSVN
jgi:methionyl-tRNA synthetase